MNKIKEFFKSARQEFAHVNWPTRAEALRLVGIVIGISIGIALFLGLFDYLFSTGLQTLVIN